MNRPVGHVAALAALCVLASLPARAADVSVGFSQGPGGYYSQTDRSGPYAVDGSGNVTPIGSQAGTTGTDFTANQTALPVVGSSFGASGPYAGYVLIKTIPAGRRNGVEVDNVSGGQIVVIRDDGTAATGAAPANASIIALAGGAAAGAQGGSWSSTTFRGRLQIYAPSATAFVTAYVD